MTRKSKSRAEGTVAALAIGGSILVMGGFLMAAVATSKRGLLAAIPTESTEDDIEAAARMLASENPRGSRALHIEQVWSQVNAKKPGQSLYDRITAGSGYGQQGRSAWPGGTRPVSTELEARNADRVLARELLVEGRHPSQLPQAVSFFEPAVQEKVLRVANRGREKQKQGLSLTAQEQRLLHYHRSADDVRADWGKHLRMVGSIDGVEFFG